jgi:hypothetical protein
MRNGIKPMLGAVLVLLSLGAGLQAADTLQLTTVGASAVMGGVYTSPYGVSVNGGPTTLMICDDFTTDSYVGLTWTATETTLSQISNSSVAGLKFATAPYSTTPGIVGGPSNVGIDYATAAVLAAQLMSLPNIGTPAENAEMAGELSFAIWGVFDTNLLQNTSTGYGTLTAGQLSAALGYITAAQGLVSAATSGGVTNLNLISINGQSINSLTVYTSNPLGASQEFLRVSMPEPSYPAVLAVDLLAVLGLIVVLRKRAVGAAN